MRRWLLAGGAAAVIVGPTVFAFFSGGFFDRPRIIGAILAWALVALAVALAPRPLPISTPGRVALAALVLLWAWTALSLGWAPLGGRTQDDLQRLALYAGFFLASLALLRGAGIRRWLEPGLALGSLVVVLYALSERLLPDLVELDRSFAAAGRLEQPLSYWNAFGLVAAIGFVLAIRIAGDPERRRALRGAAASAGVPLGLATYLSFARGALAAAAVGLLVLIALAPAGRSQFRSALIIVAAAGLAALLASRYGAVKSLDVGEQGDAGAGLRVLAGIVLLGAAAAAMVLRRPRHRLPLPSQSVPRPVIVLTATTVLLVGAALAVAVLEGGPEGASPARGADPARLGSVDSNRYRYWEVAVDSWLEKPVAGLGSGGFLVEWLKVRDRVDQSGDAHSLYLETAAELGLVGVALLFVFLGAVAAGVVRLYRLDASSAAGPAAALAAWAFHAGVDWDWEMPAVTLIALVLAAAAIASSEEGDAPLREPARTPRLEGAAAGAQAIW
jgi:hypothetical protein